MTSAYHNGILPHSVICQFAIVTYMDRIIDNSRVQPGFRVTLTQEVRKRLRVKVGDLVVFVEDDRGNIIVKKAELKAV